MSGPDAAARAALGAEIVRPAWVAFLDILGDPIRVTTAPHSVTFTGSGDEDLDGHTFSAVDPRFVSVSPIQMKEGGADTVSATLSALIGIDTELLNQLGQKTNWQGRVFRVWQFQMAEDLSRIGTVWPWHTGYMTTPKISFSGEGQTIVLESTGYLSFLSVASNRTYLSQAEYDPDDFSASASIAAANGRKAAGAGVSAGSGTYALGRELTGLQAA